MTSSIVYSAGNSGMEYNVTNPTISENGTHNNNMIVNNKAKWSLEMAIAWSKIPPKPRF
jgi:hypothetical protein